MDKKMIKLIAILVGLVLLVIILMVLANGANSSKKRTYDEVVTEFVSATKKYLKSNPSRYPTASNGYTTLTYSLLVEEKYMKSADELFKNKDANCYGDITVYYLEEDKYDYVPNLTCNVGGVQSLPKNLSNDLIGDGEVNVVLNGSGLYKRINGKWAQTEEELSGGASDDDIYYFYRGSEELDLHNYVLIDDMLFRVVKINNDGNMLMIYNGSLRSSYNWDKRYNQDVGKSQGINIYMGNGVKSAAAEKLDQFLEGNEKLADRVPFSESLKYIIEDFDLCVARRGLDEEGTDGAIECEEVIENQKVGLLPTYMYMSASLDETCNKLSDKTCGNNNYLANYTSYWTVTTNKDKSNYCFYINKSLTETICSSNATYKPILNISSRVQYTEGTGTKDDPYILDTSNYVTSKK
jgi:hypothetical protein